MKLNLILWIVGAVVFFLTYLTGVAIRAEFFGEMWNFWRLLFYCHLATFLFLWTLFVIISHWVKRPLLVFLALLITTTTVYWLNDRTMGRPNYYLLFLFSSLIAYGASQVMSRFHNKR